MARYRGLFVHISTLVVGCDAVARDEWRYGPFFLRGAFDSESFSVRAVRCFLPGVSFWFLALCLFCSCRFERLLFSGLPGCCRLVLCACAGFVGCLFFGCRLILISSCEACFVVVFPPLICFLLLGFCWCLCVCGLLCGGCCLLPRFGLIR